MNFVRDKHTICSTVVPLVVEAGQPTTIEQAMKTWWRNPRRSGGLALTESGFEAFTVAGLEHYDIEYVAKSFASGFTVLTRLNKKMPCPYYIHRAKKSIMIRIYDGRLLVLIDLYGGLEQCLNTIGESND
jgi:hypothetical protein